MFDLRRELYDKLQHQEVAYYDRNPVGRIMTRLTSDVDSLNELFTAGITDLLGDLVMIFAIIAVMLWMDVRLTFVTLLTVPMLWPLRPGFAKVRAKVMTWFERASRASMPSFRSTSPGRRQSRSSMPK
jgi:ATP-binding cassette subfamily B protein